METINSVASAAAKAVWGSPETKQEPVSGVKGNTAEGEPYDAGNMEPQEMSSTKTPLDQPSSGSHTTNSTGMDTRADAATSSKIETSEDTSSRTKTEVEKPVESAVPDKAESTKKVNLDGPGQPEEQQIPIADLDKPGPKPLETLAREHGGDAGQAAKHDTSTASSGLPGDSQGDKSHEGSGEGTGEKVVRSTGFAAEGGDFDAAAAGAAREADRLVDENNSHDNIATKSSPGHTKPGLSDSGAGGEKLSLKEKIKAKLHKH